MKSLVLLKSRAMNGKKIALLIGLALCWGPSFLFIKVAVSEIPPLTLITFRIGIAALIMLLVLLLRRQNFLHHFRKWKAFFFMGFFSAALPFFLISKGEMSISSSLAGIINGSVPIFTLILAHYTLHDEPLTRNKVLGIATAFGGILAIFLPSVLRETYIQVSGAFLVLIASISYAIGMIIAKKTLREIPGFMAATIQLLITSLYLAPLMLFIDFPIPIPSILPILSVISLALLGTVLALYLYFKTIQIAGATYLSTSCLLFPLVAILLGVIFLGERPAWNVYLGALLILTGLTLTNLLPQKAHD